MLLEHLLFGTCIVNTWLAYKSNVGLRSQHQSSITSFKEKLCMDIMIVTDEEPVPAFKQTEHQYLKEWDIFVWDKENKRRLRKACEVCYMEIALQKEWKMLRK